MTEVDVWSSAMNRTRDHTQQVRQLSDIDLPTDDLQRLARMDALLRAVAAGEGRGSISPGHGLRPHRADKQMHELKLTFSELALVYKSLRAVKTLGAFPPQDELLNDTVQLVQQALDRTV